MKKYISLLLTLVVSLFAINSFAFTPPEKPENGWYVLDQAHKLSDDQKSQLNHKIEDLNKTTKNEFGVLILQSMDGDNIEDVAQDTFRKWGVGKAGLDNGILIVISVAERKSRIQTGKGVEGDLPDLRAHDMLIQHLNPHLKRGDFFGGLDETITATSAFIESRANQKPSIASKGSALAPAPVSDNKEGGIAITILLCFVFGGLLWGAVWAISKFFEKRAEQKRYEDELFLKTIESPYSPSSKRIVPITPSYSHDAPTVSSAPPKPKAPSIPVAPIAMGTMAGVGLIAGAALAATAENEKKREKERALREREEEASRRRKKEADRKKSNSSSSSSSYSSSSSSSDSYRSYSSCSSSSSCSSGSSFGGGDSGGGGSSSDW